MPDILLKILLFIALIMSVLIVLGFFFRSAGIIKSPARKGRAENGQLPHLPSYLAFLESTGFWKAVVFVSVTVIGYKAIIMSFLGLFVLSKTGNEALLMFLIQAYAWVAYFVMGVFWVAERRLGRFLPVTGSFAGVASLLLIGPRVMLVFLIGPMVILAARMAMFHWSKDDVTLTNQRT